MYYQLIICQRERRRRTRLILYSDHSVLMTRAFTDIRVWRLKVTPPYLGTPVEHPYGPTEGGTLDNGPWKFAAV